MTVQECSLKECNSNFMTPRSEESSSVVRETELCTELGLVTSVEVIRSDPLSPLSSVKEWNELNLKKTLLDGIYAMGFNRPSQIQEAALPLLIQSSLNLVAQAQSGSGKTATFSLALLNMVDESETKPQGVCLCPTRELAIQNFDVIRKLGKFTAVKSFLAIPQCNPYDVVNGANIVVATPGKLMEFLRKKIIPPTAVKMLVLDEADEMIDHRKNLAPQVQQIRSFFPKILQVLLFSATFPPEVQQFSEAIVPNPNKIKVEKERLCISNISQYYKLCSSDSEKAKALNELYTSMTIGQSVIFVNNRSFAFNLAKQMREANHAVSLICGSQTSGKEKMDHQQRDNVMKEFRLGATKVLICTDVLSRGVDVPQVTLVINFDLPRNVNKTTVNSTEVNMETYLHRIGRTGRFGLNGIAISFVTEDEMRLIKEIKSFYNCSIQELPNDCEEIDNMVQKLRAI